MDTFHFSVNKLGENYQTTLFRHKTTQFSEN